MDISWFWLVVGLIPYSIQPQQTKDEQILTEKALFWRLMIRWRKEWSHVQEIYRLHRNILERLLRNADQLRWRFRLQKQV